MSECVEACLDDHIELFNQYSDNLIEHAKSLEARIEALENAAKQAVGKAISIGNQYSDCDSHVLDLDMVWELIHLCDEDSDLAALLQEPTK